MGPGAGRRTALGLGLMAALSGASLMSQPAMPTVQLTWPGHATNFVFTTSAQQGYYYTMQSSADLSSWASLGALYANGGYLCWTSAVPAQPGTQFFRSKVNPPNTAVVTNYHGWNNAVLLSNGQVEVLVVPNAGRVMQFRFAGSTNGPFWENSKLYGVTSSSANWNTTGAFGGDKSWPAPQSDWSAGGWPPPAGFDGSPYTCGITNGVVTITSPVDSSYDIQVTRTIQLVFDQTVLQINTVFHRVSSATHSNPVGVWVITQVSDPVGIYVPVPAQSIFAPAGYCQLGSGLPTGFKNVSGLISFTRDPAAQHHLGFDANSLAWVGTNVSMRIDAPRVAGLSKTNYPNSGCNTAVYTNNGSTNNVGDATYAELECFAPLTNLLTGQSVTFVTTYTLFNRTESSPDTEARKILGLSTQ